MKIEKEYDNIQIQYRDDEEAKNEFITFLVEHFLNNDIEKEGKQG